MSEYTACDGSETRASQSARSTIAAIQPATQRRPRSRGRAGANAAEEGCSCMRWVSALRVDPGSSP